MRIWRVKGERQDGPVAEQHTRFIQAPTEPHAREVAGRAGLRVSEIRPIQDRAEIPSSAAVVPFARDAAREDPLHIIADSPLVRSPVLTIAMGVLLGGILTTCLWFAVAFFAGGAIRFGR